VTKFGVSAENVQATIDTPKSHQGIFLPERKNSAVFFPALLEVIKPIDRTIMKKMIRISQSIK
jgi:hypothetical protein